MCPRPASTTLFVSAGVTADTAMRLARYFGTSTDFWMGLQSDHEMAVARLELADVLESITPRQPIAA